MQENFQDNDDTTKVKKPISKDFTKMRFQKCTNAKTSSYYSILPSIDSYKSIAVIIHSKWGIQP